MASLTPMPNSESRRPTFLRQWRQFRDLNQADAADRLDIKQGTLSKIERGDIPYNQDFLERAALAYGCDVEDLLSVDPLKPDPPKLVYSRLRNAPKAVQEQALRILDALLKDGTNG